MKTKKQIMSEIEECQSQIEYFELLNKKAHDAISALAHNALISERVYEEIFDKLDPVINIEQDVESITKRIETLKWVLSKDTDCEW